MVASMLSARLNIPLWQPVEIVCLEESSIAFDRVAIAGCVAYVRLTAEIEIDVFPTRRRSHAT
jgi:hypothetical protein